MQIGIIGLGLVGNAIAGRLLAVGHAVYGYDIADAACNNAKSIGAQVQASGNSGDTILIYA